MSHISQPARGLIRSNVKALEEGLDVLNMLDQGHFTGCLQPTFQSTIGAHFRHALEHYQCFLEQQLRGVISYDQRQRDQQLEENPDYARQVLKEVCTQLMELDVSGHDRSAKASLKIDDQPLDAAIATSLERELMFLHSHTVHHYAIIAAMARAQGKCPQQDFGVAIATRTYQAGCNKQAVAQSTRG